MSRWPRYGLPVLFLVSQAWMTYGQIGTWRDNPTLWSHAATIAPLKPRVVHNFGLSLLAAGHRDAGIAQLHLAMAMTARPHVPEWDRAVTREMAARNLARVQP